MILESGLRFMMGWQGILEVVSRGDRYICLSRKGWEVSAQRTRVDALISLPLGGKVCHADAVMLTHGSTITRYLSAANPGEPSGCVTLSEHAQPKTLSLRLTLRNLDPNFTSSAALCPRRGDLEPLKNYTSR